MTFNRNEQIAILALSAALLVGTAVTLVDTWWPDAIDEFAVKKGAVPVPPMPVDSVSSPPPSAGAEPSPQSTGGSVPLLRSGRPSAGVTKDPSPLPLVDVNTAPEALLVTLPRIGPATARRIITHRETHGPFRRPEDLLEVRGIGPRTLEGLKDRISVGSP